MYHTCTTAHLGILFGTCRHPYSLKPIVQPDKMHVSDAHSRQLRYIFVLGIVYSLHQSTDFRLFV